ncbi:MAG: RNA polymerase sigma factor RpoD/SigA [Nitrospinota bacterium]
MTSYRKDNQNSFNVLGAYLKEISCLKPLSRKEEKILAERRDQWSLNELVIRNLKYVVSVANRYKGCGLSLHDLISEGNLGLIQAAKRFDPLRGVKFITYAVWWIRHAIMHALAEQSGSVRLPIKQAGLLYKIGLKYKDLFQLYERDPTVEEIARELGIHSKEVESIMRVYRSHLSLDAHLSEDDDTSYIDMLEDTTGPSLEEELMQSSLKKEIDDLINKLSPREKKILKMRFGFQGEPMTLKEIGKKIGLSRERIRQIEKRAKFKLLSKAETKALRDYLN